MSFKSFFRTLIFLLMLFVVLYAGMYNTEDISFSFPVALQKSVREPAALILFAAFAIGVLAGTMLHSGGGKSRSSSKDK